MYVSSALSAQHGLHRLSLPSKRRRRAPHVFVLNDAIAYCKSALHDQAAFASFSSGYTPWTPSNDLTARHIAIASHTGQGSSKARQQTFQAARTTVACWFPERLLVVCRNVGVVHRAIHSRRAARRLCQHHSGQTFMSTSWLWPSRHTGHVPAS